PAQQTALRSHGWVPCHLPGRPGGRQRVIRLGEREWRSREQDAKNHRPSPAEKNGCWRVRRKKVIGQNCGPWAASRAVRHPVVLVYLSRPGATRFFQRSAKPY